MVALGDSQGPGRVPSPLVLGLTVTLEGHLFIPYLWGCWLSGALHPSALFIASFESEGPENHMEKDSWKALR